MGQNKTRRDPPNDFEKKSRAKRPDIGAALKQVIAATVIFVVGKGIREIAIRLWAIARVGQSKYAHMRTMENENT